jgi:hypothetical protein
MYVNISYEELECSSESGDFFIGEYANPITKNIIFLLIWG